MSTTISKPLNRHLHVRGVYSSTGKKDEQYFDKELPQDIKITCHYVSAGKEVKKEDQVFETSPYGYYEAENLRLCVGNPENAGAILQKATNMKSLKKHWIEIAKALGVDTTQMKSKTEWQNLLKPIIKALTDPLDIENHVMPQ